MGWKGGGERGGNRLKNKKQVKKKEGGVGVWFPYETNSEKGGGEVQREYVKGHDARPLKSSGSAIKKRGPRTLKGRRKKKSIGRKGGDPSN